MIQTESVRGVHVKSRGVVRQVHSESALHGLTTDDHRIVLVVAAEGSDHDDEILTQRHPILNLPQGGLWQG